ncbi:hypothetical protein NDU88_001426 [Pleurodeles waltl]|uniref:Uncharacterized protein n=1 Tax=Pleurodeles waltl TaxID=8319 RepID=A0AAV7TIA1_PLEWA|nr:hypothetical protein NDU88_001426 [Pleurodeles waltl]
MKTVKPPPGPPEEPDGMRNVEVKSQLCKLCIRYGMLYPARLPVDVNSKARILENPSDALEFCKNIAKQPDRGSGDRPKGFPPDAQNSASMDMFPGE